MAHCPKCNSNGIRKSPTRSQWERWRKDITSARPYRCRACKTLDRFHTPSDTDDV